MADIRYSLRYETTWWQDVCRIEPHSLKWAELVDGIEDFLERTPEAVRRRTRRGSYVMQTERYGFRDVHPMYVLFRVVRLASHPTIFEPPGGLLSLRHVITEADVRMGLFYDYGDDLAAECQELRRSLLNADR